MYTTITIKGTHCASCKALIEDVCKENPCIISCSVDYQTGKTEIEYKDCLDWQAFKKEVESLGEYQVMLAQT